MPSSRSRGHLGHPRLGVAHGGGVIAVDIAEIALAVDQRIADGEILRQADQRVVDGLVAMRMELADHVADDARDFLKPEPGSSRSWRIAWRMRRWTGFSPSRTSGSARCMIVDSA